MKNANNLSRTWLRRPRWRIIGFAVFLALTIYFLPIHRQNSDSFLVLSQSATTTADGQQVLPEQLPFGIQLLSFAKAQTTTLQLTKSGPASAVQGGPIVYSLTISNTTAISAQQVKVRDYSPTNTLTSLFFAPSGWSVTNYGSYVEWSTSSLLGNSADPLLLVVDADSPLPNGTIITNAVYTATATNADAIIGSPVITTRIKAPEFSTLNKTVSPTTVIPGNLLTYTLTISNSGEYQADDVIITDTIPTHTSYVTSTPAAVAGSNVVTWTISRIEVGETAVLTLVVQTDPVITNGIDIENTSYRAASTNVYTPVVGADLAPAIVNSQPALTITKTASAPTVEAGDLLTYLITVTNQISATDYARNVLVADDIPADTVFEDAAFIVGTGTIISPTVGTTGPVTYTVSTPSQLNAGQPVVMSVTVRAKSPLPNGTVITNTYRVSASNIAQPIAGQPVTTTVTSSPQITLSKTVQPQVVLTNQPLEYTVTVTNSGNATAFNVPFTDTLPSSFTPLTSTWSATITGTDLSGTPGVVTFTIPVTSGFTGGQFPNIVTATVEGVPITTGPVATVTVVPEIFEVVKTADHDPVVPGTPLTYTIAITNRTNTLQTAVITETYPGEVTYFTAEPLPDTPPNIWSLSVPPFGTQIITITVTVSNPLNNGLVFTNTVQVGNTVNPLVVVANAANTVVSTPTLEVSKVGQPSVVEAGGLITYTIRYTNSGTMDATGVVITDIFPANTNFYSGGGSLIAGGRQWTVPPVTGNGGTGQLQLTLLVDTPLDNGTTLTNVVSISANQPTTDVYTAFNTVSSAPVLEITKLADPEPVQAGDTLTYTIQYTNTGTDGASNIIITDTLPVSVTFSNASTSPTSILGNLLVWNALPNLSPANGVQNIVVTVVVTQPVVSGTQIVNQVDISANNATLATDQVTSTINSSPVWEISKIPSSDPVTAGAALTYTITYTNVGNTHATGVTITDTLDSGVSFVSATDSGAETSLGSGVVEWTIPGTVLANGAPGNVQLTVTVAPTLSNGSLLTNNFEIISSQNTASTADSIITTVQAPVLTVTKTVSPNIGYVRAGDSVEYTITYSNLGPVTSTNIYITDTLPISITNVVSSSADATFFNSPSPGVVVWLGAALGASSSGEITVQGQVITSPWASTGGQITNNVIVDSGGYTAANSVSTEGRPGLPFSVIVDALPFTQIVGGNVWIEGDVTDAYGNFVYDGTPVTFTTSLAGSSVTTPTVNTVNGTASTFVTSTTVGTSTVTAQTVGPVSGTTVVTFTAGPAVSLQLSATSPQTAGVAFPLTVTALDQYGNIATGFTDAITLTDTTGTISGGPVNVINGTGVANVTIMTATAPDSTTITGTNGALTGITPVVIQINLTDLQLSLAADSPIRLCSTGILTATLTDIGGNPLSNYTISFLHTGNFQPASGTTRNTNSNGVATLTVTRLDGSTITPDGVDAHWIGDPSNVEDNASVGTTLPPNPADVSINVFVSPGSIAADGSATSLLSADVQCGGYDAIDGTVVDFSLAPQLGLLPTSPFTAAISSGVATRVITAGTTAGTTTITGTVYSPAISDTTTLTLLQPASLVITKTAVPASGNVNPGDTIAYTVLVENQGSTAAAGVIITDDLDSDVGYVSGSDSSNGSFSESAGQIVVTTPSLGSGQSLTATWQVTVTAATSGTLIENYANANSNTTSIITSSIVSHNVVTVPVTTGNIFLPIILKGCCLPNLIIESFDVQSSGVGAAPVVTVTVRNAGQASTGSGFWVDVYVDPDRDPNTFSDGNRRWDRPQINAIRGIAWPVSSPLAAGDSVTLVSTVGTAPFPLTNWNWSGLLPGSYRFVTFADSFDAQNNSYVEILESVENTDNQTATDVSVSSLEVGTSSVQPSPPQPLSPRRDLGR